MEDGDVHVFDETITQARVAKNVPRYTTDGLQYAETIHAYIDGGAANHKTLPKAAARLKEMRVPIQNASSILSVANSIKDHVERTRKMPVAAVRFNPTTTTALAASNVDDSTSDDDLVSDGCGCSAPVDCRCDDEPKGKSATAKKSLVVARRGPTFADRLAALSVDERKVVLS